MPNRDTNKEWGALRKTQCAFLRKNGHPGTGGLTVIIGMLVEMGSGLGGDLGIFA